MSALNVQLDERVRQRIESRARENGYESAEKYVEAMLIADAAGADIDDEALEKLLLERADDPVVDCDEQDFQQMRRKFYERYGRGTEGGAVP